MISKLAKAIDDLYAAFSDVSVPRRIDGCSHCIEDDEVARLLKLPLRELAADDLTPYASSAFLTVGDVSDYFYFLPRILEISIRDESWWPDIEVTARAIQATGLDSWRSDRRAALESLLDAVVEDIIDSKDYERLDSWLCAIARMKLDVRPRLAMIESDPEAVFAYFADNAEKIDHGRLTNAFWELPNDGHDIIVQWLRSDAISEIYWSRFR